MRPLTFVAALALVVLGCGAQGVSLGSEEACVLDAELAAAQESSADASLPACAVIGRNQLVNQGLESPAVASVSDCPTAFCQVAASQVWGWRTTSETQVMELWTDGYLGVPAAEGGQFVELDANTPDTIYQDLVLTPGEPVYWSVLHRGRLGDETIEVLLGPPESPVSQGSFTSSDQDWQEHSGIYRVGNDETVTRFSLASRSGTSEGNLVDNAVLAPIEVRQ
jgi:hypothetical protein